jgi:cell division protein FtsB
MFAGIFLMRFNRVMQEVNRGIWDTLTKLVVGLIVVAGVVLLVVCYLPGTERKQRMLREIQTTESAVKKEDETARALTGSINTLRNDPKAVERLARDKFGYAKPGETVVRFEELPTNAVRKN